MILPAGTQVVTRSPSSRGGYVRPAGSVGAVVQPPTDHLHSYRIRFIDGSEGALRRDEFTVLKDHQRPPIGAISAGHDEWGLIDHVVFRCVIGSRAYGLDDQSSDVDRRGVYLAPAEMHWSIGGVPEQLEDHAAQECYWELEKFLTLGLKANPNVLECLYSPLIEFTKPIAEELLGMRGAFLSKLVYQTYNGYVLSQFKKLSTRVRLDGQIKWKHAMHLIRLLLAGIQTLRDGVVPVAVGFERDRLLAIKQGKTDWAEVDAWRLELHRQFEFAFAETKLPDRPDYARVDDLLIRARRLQAQTVAAREVSGAQASETAATAAGPVTKLDQHADLLDFVERAPVPMLFVTISGAHLYGFPSPDSDFDLRGAHVLPVDELVGLGRPNETIEQSKKDGDLELDFVSHDVLKFFRLLLKPNGYVLEQLFSPWVLHTTPEHDELKLLAGGLITKRHSHHYFGFARSQWELFESSRRVKPLLYTYRVLLSGIYLMQTGLVEADIRRLKEVFRISHLDELVERKVSGPERQQMEGVDIDFHAAEIQRLFEDLESARDQSSLRAEPTGRAELDALLRRIRRRLA